MTETMRREATRRWCNTAAASNLGQMLNKICLKDGIPLVNIVRSTEQAGILRRSAQACGGFELADFHGRSHRRAGGDRATLAFDAIGGGRLAGQVLTCMEIAANKSAKVYSRYGSSVHKQVYIYAVSIRVRSN